MSGKSKVVGSVRLPRNVVRAENTPHDGANIGSNGPSRGSISQTVPFRPSHGGNGKTAIAVNGIGTPVDRLMPELQRLAEGTGYNIVGLYNATGGAVRDIGETVADKWFNLRRKKENPANLATDALAARVLEQLHEREDVHIIAHSQGALIAANALRMVEKLLTDSDERDLLKKISVETYGGVSASYPGSGTIQYDHYVNTVDPYVMSLGLGRPGVRRLRGVDPDSVHRFREMRWKPAFEGENPPTHGWSVYIKNRKSSF